MFLLQGFSKPVEAIQSVRKGKLHCDIGRAKSVALLPAETERRWSVTTPQWPVMNAILCGVSRDQFMARHRSNHIQVVYAPDSATASSALATKSAMLAELGIEVNLCGNCGL